MKELRLEFCKREGRKGQRRCYLLRVGIVVCVMRATKMFEFCQRKIRHFGTAVSFEVKGDSLDKETSPFASYTLSIY